MFRAPAVALVSALFLVSAPVYAVVIDFDAFAPNMDVTTLSTEDVTFSSSGTRAPHTAASAEASSGPNILVGSTPFDPIFMDFGSLYSGDVGVTLISVGNAVVHAAIFGPDLTTILDELWVQNPGTGVGYQNQDPIVLSAEGISRLALRITAPFPGDGFGIDDVWFDVDAPVPPAPPAPPTTNPVPEPATALLLGAGLLATAFARRRSRG